MTSDKHWIIMLVENTPEWSTANQGTVKALPLQRKARFPCKIHAFEICPKERRVIDQGYWKSGEREFCHV
jgi:hypothetical protein